MKEPIISSKHAIFFFVFALLAILFNPFEEKSDKEIMAMVQQNRDKNRGQEDHSKHDMKAADDSQEFRGVFYGYLPCDDCAGVKMTLSLKNKQNYLLVTQYARESNKEYYNKGKYVWDEENKLVTLTARKDGEIQKYRIKSEGELVLLKPDGQKLEGDQSQYSLFRTDKNKSREIHIH